MLSFVIDVVGAFLAVKNVRNLGFLIFVAVLIGGFSAIGSNMLIYMVAPDSFTPKEIFTRIIFGVVVHPVITTVASLLFRRFLKNRPD
jgi:hypothetical protein